MKRYLAALVVLVLGATWARPTYAAISLPFVFTPFTTISSSQVNADFSALATNATDKRGDTLTGTMNTQLIQPSSTATYDVGANAIRYRDAYFSGQLNSATVLTTSTITSGGNILFTTDNANDIGGSGANRPRDVRVARNYVGPSEFNASSACSGTITVDFSANGPVQKVTRTGACTMNLTAPPSPQSVVVRVIAGSGAAGVVFSPTPKYPNGTVPTYTNTLNAIDIVTLYWDGSTWYAFQQPNLS